jgi:peptide/nickel transport system permease protein
VIEEGIDMSEANPVVDTTGQPAPTVVQQLQFGLKSKPRTLIGDAWRRFRRHKLAMIGASILVIFIITVLIGPSIYLLRSPDITDFKAYTEQLDFVTILSGPTAEHPFGTDDLGRDQLSRAIYGGRISLLVGFTAMLIAISLGTVVGAAAGFLGGTVDQVLMRITDLFLSLPGLPLIILMVYLFREPVQKALGQETGIFVIVVVMIGGLAWMQTARIVRSSFLSLKEKEFVEAANCLGISKAAIMFRHILPNAFSPIIVAATLEIGNAIIQESTLSFLGVGFPPDTPTWGRLVTDGSQFLQAGAHLALFPGALIFLTVLSINFMGDGLRDALDPRSRL